MARSVIVTGGSRGIGAATAILAARDGWEVCLSYVSHADEAEAIVTRIAATGGRAIAARADGGNEAALVAMFARCALHVPSVARPPFLVEI